MKTARSTMQGPLGAGRLALLPALLLSGAGASAAGGATASSQLPLLLLMVPLLAAVGLAVRAWFPRLRAASPARRAQRAIDWPQLARQCSQFFDAHGLQGYDPQVRWDPARDLVLRRDRHTCLVRARFWNARQVDAAAVQQLARDAARAGAGRGILLCARDVFTPTARQLARQQGILLLDAAHMPTRATPRPTASAPAAERVSKPAALDAAPAGSRLAPLLRSDFPARARRGFQPTEPLETPAVEPHQPTVALPRKVPLLAERAPVVARREFQPTEPLETSAVEPQAVSHQPTVALPRKVPLLAERAPVAARREFQPTEPLVDAAIAEHRVAPATHAMPRAAASATPSRREFLPTSPMPLGGLAAP